MKLKKTRRKVVTLGVVGCFLLALSAAIGISSASTSTLYVKPGATGDCSEWANACTLQIALGMAIPSDEIWVMTGIYTPTTTITDSTATFQLKSGVALYGGFAGTESSLEDRDWQSNITVLSGDIDDNDIADPNGVITATIYITGSNSYHVVTSSAVTETCVLDGFTITGGNAQGDVWNSRGGGMFNNGASPTVTNVTFSGNYAEIFGGGMHNYDYSSPTLTNVTFSGNSAHYAGGGMDNHHDSSPTLANVTFSGNSASCGNSYCYGGGMANWYNSTPTLTNVTFSGNSADAGGGGMSNLSSSPTLTNVTFSGNGATDGGAMHNRGSSPALTNVIFSGNGAWNGGGMCNDQNSNPTLTNSILWGNTASVGTQICNDDTSTSAVSYSLVEGGYPGTGNIEADPQFEDPDGADDIVGTLDDNLRLQVSSPAIDAGDNSALPADALDLDGDGDTGEPLPFDLDGNPRVVNGTVDMGAYEHPPDTDQDGLSDSVEDGAPNGGDGNNDGIPDSQQANVASLPNAVDAQYVTLASPEGTAFVGVSAVDNPSPGDAPPGVEFPVGFFEFTLQGIDQGGATTVTQLLPPDTTLNTYYKHGPTPENSQTDYWYEFLFDGATGAEILSDRVVLHFVDGQRGDDDLTANGEIVEPGAPGLIPNRPPTVAAEESNVTVDEGQTATNTGTVSDPDGDTVALSASVGMLTNSGDGNWSWSFTTTDGPDDSQMVTITADDGKGGTSQASFVLTVDNVAPDIGAVTAPTEPVNINDQPVTVSASFSDPGGTHDEPYTCTFDYDYGGDGLGPQSGTVTGNTCTGEPTYSEAGVYTVLVTVTDKDVGLGEAIYQFVVVYDPSAGFVTGGGWIWSEPGAYAADPELEGKATFGFVSRYKRGASVPTGQTEFQFRVADLNFHSDSYEWLVVTGSNYARFKGSGTINGMGEYKFMLWAGDGEADTFRIRIWDEDELGVETDIYDNGFDQAIAGGSVVIHKR